MKITDLVKLGQMALSKVEESSAQGTVAPAEQLYIKSSVQDFEISETAQRVNSSRATISKPDWSRVTYGIVEELKKAKEFEVIASQIAKKYKANIQKIAGNSGNELSQTKYWLSNFLQKIVYEKLQNTLSEDQIIEYAALFKSELELAPYEYKCVIYLKGLFLEPEKIQINDHLLLRRVQKNDLESEDSFFGYSPMQFGLDIPSSILELEQTFESEQILYNFIERILNALRLYKLNAVSSGGRDQIKKSIIWPGGTGHHGNPWQRSFPFRNYTIKNTEAEKLPSYLNELESKLNFQRHEKEYRAFAIALDWFNISLLESVDMDRRLMSAVLGLEAMLTLDGERGENAYKLSMRVARMLGTLTTLDGLRIKEDVEKAYSFRNKIAHGSYISDENKKAINDLFPDIANYLRLCILIMILNREKGKEKIVTLIDKSIISEVESEAFKNAIKPALGENVAV